MTKINEDDPDLDSANLAHLARDMRAILLELREVVKYMKDAESEVPEKIRRFIMYYHDVHDIKNLYNENGQEPPRHIYNEIERCSDRFRHILDEMYGDQGAFEKVRQDMTKREGNRYDYSHQLTTEKHK